MNGRRYQELTNQHLKQAISYFDNCKPRQIKRLPLLLSIKYIPLTATRSFNEAKGFVMNDYQTLLEEEWIKELRKKYPVEMDQKVLATILNEAKAANPPIIKETTAFWRLRSNN